MLAENNNYLLNWSAGKHYRLALAANIPKIADDKLRELDKWLKDLRDLPGGNLRTERYKSQRAEKSKEYFLRFDLKQIKWFSY